MLSREFIQKYFGPHPEHPVFGTIKGYDSGWEFYRSVPTPGLDAPAVQFTIDSDPNETHVHNYESLLANWSTVWAVAFGRLREIIEDYGYTEALTTDAFTVSLRLPNEPFAADS